MIWIDYLFYGSLFAIWLFSFSSRALFHRLAHKHGTVIMWQRRSENVMMVGRKCAVCGQVTEITIHKPSYERAMGDKKP